MSSWSISLYPSFWLRMAASEDAFCTILVKQRRNLFLSVTIAIVILTAVRVMTEENTVRSNTEDNDEILCLLVAEGRNDIVTRYGFYVNGGPVLLATWFGTYASQRELSPTFSNFQIFTFVMKQWSYNWVVFSRIEQEIWTGDRVYIKIGTSKNIYFNFNQLNIFLNKYFGKNLFLLKNIEQILIYWNILNIEI